MAQQGVPGVALGLIEDQEVLWSGGFGHAYVGSRRAMDAGLEYAGDLFRKYVLKK